MFKIYGNTLPADAPPELRLDVESMSELYRLADVNGKAQITTSQLTTFVGQEAARCDNAENMA
jgi:hypothetical protein